MKTFQETNLQPVLRAIAEISAIKFTKVHRELGSLSADELSPEDLQSLVECSYALRLAERAIATAIAHVFKLYMATPSPGAEPPPGAEPIGSPKSGR